MNIQDPKLLNRIIEEVAKLGFVASFNPTAVFCEKKGEYLLPLCYITHYYDKNSCISAFNSFGKEIKAGIRKLYHRDISETFAYVTQLEKDRNVVVEKNESYIYIADPASNNECMMLVLSGNKYCDQDGNHIDLFIQYKSDEIRDKIFTCFSRAFKG